MNTWYLYLSTFLEYLRHHCSELIVIVIIMIITKRCQHAIVTEADRSCCAMPIDFEDPAAKLPITRRVLMLCDRWSDWCSGKAIINQHLALGLCSFGGVEVYRSLQ